MAPRERWRSLVVAGGMLAIAGTVLLIALVLRARGLQEAANVAQLVSVVLALPALAIPLMNWWRQGQRAKSHREPEPAGGKVEISKSADSRIVEIGDRRPWMAPPLDRMVQRPDLGNCLIAALTTAKPTDVGLTTGLQGAGGFGKTRLATWVCHRPEIKDRYRGGLLWVTVGQNVHGADLALRINDLVFALSGERPTVSDPDVAGAELGRLLDDRQPVLLVIDDLWDESQLRSFRFGGRTCSRLVTTRIPDVLPKESEQIRVDAMTVDEAKQLIATGVSELDAGMIERMSEVAGRWPVLLNLINGVLQRRVERGQRPWRAAEDILQRLLADGPAALDPARPADRTRAVAATVGASLVLLDEEERERYFDLAIFPEDVDIPVNVLSLIWPGPRLEALREQLFGLGLVADYRLDSPGPRLIMHDVIRAYLLSQRSADNRAAVHCRLVNKAANLLNRHSDSSVTQWWTLPANIQPE